MYYLYSKSCEYAIRILTRACQAGKTDCFSVKEMCRLADVPESYSRKSLQSLAKAGFLQAVRGPGGGYRLAIPPQKISVLEIIEAIDGHEAFDQCVMGLEECGCDNPCPLHDAWMKVKNKYLSELNRRTLNDLIRFHK